MIKVRLIRSGLACKRTRPAEKHHSSKSFLSKMQSDTSNLDPSSGLWDLQWADVDPPLLAPKVPDDVDRSVLLVLPNFDSLKDKLIGSFISLNYLTTLLPAPTQDIVTSIRAGAGDSAIEKIISESVAQFGVQLQNKLQSASFTEVVVSFAPDSYAIEMALQDSMSYHRSTAFNIIASYFSQLATVLIREIRQFCSRVSGSHPLRMWWITRGAVVIDGDSDCRAEVSIASQAIITGFSRVLSGEMADIRSIVVDLQQNLHQTSEEANSFAHYVSASRPHFFHPSSRVQETELVLRKAGTHWFAPRLRKLNVSCDRTDPFHCKQDGIYIITGGVGGLGFEVTKWLVQHAGAKKVFLLGRSPPSGDLKTRLLDLESATGSSIEFHKCDVSNMQDTEKIFEKIAGLKACVLRGIFHLAGVLHPSSLMDTSWANLHPTLAGKVLGGLNILDALEKFPTVAENLEVFATFSSVTSVLFAPNSAAYIIANTVLDNLAWCRTTQNCGITLNINWCPWSGTGMAVDSFRQFWESRGLGSISGPTATSLFGHILLQQPTRSLLVQPADWALYCRKLGFTLPLVRNVLIESLNSTKPIEQPVLQDSAVEPLAIVGLACRFPGGANDTDAFWNILSQGQDTVKPIPRSRFDALQHFSAGEARPYKANTRDAALLEPEEQVYEFDAKFFGVSPREAAFMDPQLRLLLHVTSEALQDANIPVKSLRESMTGVFIGASNFDYTRLIHEARADLRDHFASMSTSESMLAGRISFWLQSFGPSVVLDGSCASSLMAMHAGCQSLRAGDCDMAIVGGVSLALRPEKWIAYSQLHMMAADGRCKAFDERGNGFGRGEGCGVVVIKKLSQARKNGDRVLATVLGTSSMHVGRPDAGGITMPSRKAQQVLMTRTLQASGLRPSQVDYVEAHGTGTQAGDPHELNAIKAVYGSTARKTPLFLGSVKSSIGHLEPAAGIAGVIKSVLMLRNGAIPPQIQYLKHNSKLPLLEEIPATIPLQLTRWRSSEPRRVAINSFGYNGSMGHVILQEEPESTETGSLSAGQFGPVLLPISAASQSSLIALCKKLSSELRLNPTCLFDLSATAALYRDHFPCRVAIIASSASEMVASLDRVAQGSNEPNCFMGSSTVVEKMAFLFTGQGSQYYNMGRGLYEANRTFRDVMNTIDGICRPHIGGRSLLAALYPTEQVAPGSVFEKEHPDLVQLALFALEYSMAKFWISCGVVADYFLGHSLGEYVAACLAGAFDLATAIELVAARSAIMVQLPKSGVMASINASVDIVTQAIRETALASKISIAAVNGPTLCVVSGSEADVVLLLETPVLLNCRKQLLKVTSAFHSHLVEPLLVPFEAILQKLQPRMRKPSIPVVCNLHGRVASGNDLCSPKYWCDHMRQTVQFFSCSRQLFDLGARKFVEMGPHPVLTQLAAGCLEPSQSMSCIWLPSLRRPSPPGLHEPHPGDMNTILSVAASLYVSGVSIDWNGIYLAGSFVPAHFPSYAWDMERYELPHKLSETRAFGLGSKNDNPEATNKSLDQPFVSGDSDTPIVEMFGVDHTTVRSTIRRIVTELLELKDQAALGDTTPLLQLGMDSLLAMQLSFQLGQALGTKLPPTLAISLRTVDAIADFIAHQAATRASASSSSQPKFSQTNSCGTPAASSHSALAPSNVSALVESLVKKLLALPASQELSRTVTFQELGMDSLISIELISQLGRALNRQLPPTLANSVRTIEALSAYLGGQNSSNAVVPSVVQHPKLALGPRIPWKESNVALTAPLAIVGSGGHTLTLIGALYAAKRPILGIYTNQVEKVGQSILGVPIKGVLADVPEGVPVHIAIGSWKMRREWVAMYAHRNPFATIIHPAAQICHPSVSVGEGSYVGCGTVLEAEVLVGAHTILSANTGIGHNSSIGSFVLTGGNVTISGGAYVGDDCLLGANASIAPKGVIGNRVTVAAGSSVMTKVPDGLLVIGVPAVSDGVQEL